MFDNSYLYNEKIKDSHIVSFYREISCNSGRVFTHMHYHDYFEILYIKKGKVKMLINGSSFMAEENSMLLINPYENHYGEILSESLGYYCIVFDVKALGLPEETELLSSTKKYVNHIQECPEFHSYIDAVNTAYGSGDSAWDLCARGNLLLIFYFLSDKITKHISSGQIYFEKKVILYIGDNYMYDITSADIAKAIGYNQNYFCRAFKKSFSCRFCDYLNDYRIKQAQMLLRNHRISDVAAMVGFSNTNYFSAVFKKVTGLSPKEYKNADLHG